MNINLTYSGWIGEQNVFFQFAQHPLLNGLKPPRTLPVTFKD